MGVTEGPTTLCEGRRGRYAATSQRPSMGVAEGTATLYNGGRRDGSCAYVARRPKQWGDKGSSVDVFGSLGQCRSVMRDTRRIKDYCKRRKEPSTPPLPEDLIEKLKNLSLGPAARPKEKQGKLRVFTDPYKILEEEQEKWPPEQELSSKSLQLFYLKIKFEITEGINEDSTIQDRQPDDWEDALWEEQIKRYSIIPDEMTPIIEYMCLVSILTRSYEAWHNGEANLLITRGLVDDPEPLYNNNNTDKATVYNNFPFILAHKLTPNAIIPIQRTPGAAGFDLAFNEAQTIEPRGRGVVSTGLCLEIPWESYGRIAARSSAAWKFGIDIGAGVIDSDYRAIKVSDYHRQLTRTIIKGIPDTLGEPSGKFDYYVNYALSNPLSDLELPAPSWDDNTITTTQSILNKLLPREKHLASVCLEDTIFQQERSPENHAGTTSSWANVPRSMDLSSESIDMEDKFFDHIQYLADLTIPFAEPPVWDPSDTTDWINPFALENGGDEGTQLLAAGFETTEMEYPILKKLMEVTTTQDVENPLQQVYLTSTVISPYRPPKDTAMGPPATPQQEPIMGGVVWNRLWVACRKKLGSFIPTIFHCEWVDPIRSMRGVPNWWLSKRIVSSRQTEAKCFSRDSSLLRMDGVVVIVSSSQDGAGNSRSGKGSGVRNLDGFVWEKGLSLHKLLAEEVAQK
ncbi:hypothetical protein ZIOFF_068085 [Zingiber officinale]|uniref:dUTP diphosphatase n=1 Tax=Zingiber officinale TaxID=94328 RepID=A0A8J5CE86_ZINOF|nr:hypothetical protein ZIOFF_068085 [Zingiber officinale]